MPQELSFTDRDLAKGAEPGEIVRSDTPGLFALRGKAGWAFYYQRDVKVRGRRKTVKKRLEATSVAAARKAATVLAGKLEAEPTPGDTTLLQAWENYKRRHLERKGKSEISIRWFEDQIMRVHKAWLNKPLAKLGADREALQNRHDELGEGGKVSAANAAMRAFRAVYRYQQNTDAALPNLPRFSMFEERLKQEAIGDRAAWWAQIGAMENRVRACFHVLCLLTGSRAGALSRARWEHLNLGRAARTITVDGERKPQPGHSIHIPRPKGGTDNAYNIPLSVDIVRWLRKARAAAEIEATGRPLCRGWIFPSRDSDTGHLKDWSEKPHILMHVGHDLRRTYRTEADERATYMQVKRLLNHKTKKSADVSERYYVDTPESWAARVEAQGRISKALSQ
jgi:integrase